MNKKAILICMLIGLIILTTACVKTIEEVKNEDMIGKKVAVKGEVGLSVKLGSLSGYTLKDDTGTIGVSSQNLPKEGETVTAKGVLMKDIILGYYIKTD